MAIRHLVAGLSVLVATLLLGVHPALACDCHESPPACEAFWMAPVVFVGHIESVALKKGTGKDEAHQVVRFLVAEGLRGTSASTIDLINGFDNCSFQFAAGEDWLIYAFPTRDGSGLITFLCAGSRPLKFATRDLGYARSVPKRSPNTGRIFGHVVYVRGDKIIPVTGARISLSPPGTKHPDVSLTDAEGHYEIAGDKGGNKLVAELPRGMTLRPEDLTVELLDSRACAERELWADYPGEISGRILTNAGTPMPNAKVAVLRAGYNNYGRDRQVMTDRSGRFRVSGLIPDDYVVGVTINRELTPERVEPRYFYFGGATTKSAARRIQVEGGTHQVLPDLILPKNMPAR